MDGQALDISLGQEGEPPAKIVERIEAALKYSVRTSHPRFFDKLYAGSDPVGQVAELITAVLNTNVHTYAVAPAFAMMEQEVLKSMAAQVSTPCMVILPQGCRITSHNTHPCTHA